MNNRDILSMIEKNINLNQDLIVSRTTVMPLNFNEPELPVALCEKLRHVQIIMAADGSLHFYTFGLQIDRTDD